MEKNILKISRKNLKRTENKNGSQKKLKKNLKEIPLDYSITELELEDKLKALQPKKAC